MRLMSKATTSGKVDYFRLPRPLWRKLKKHLPTKKREQARRQAEGVRQSRRQRYLVRALDGLPMEGSPSGLVRGLLKRRPRAFPEVEENGSLREADEMDGRVLRQRERWDLLEVASDGLQELSCSSGRGENGQEPHRQRQVGREDKPPCRPKRRSPFGGTHRRQST